MVKGTLKALSLEYDGLIDKEKMEDVRVCKGTDASFAKYNEVFQGIEKLVQKDQPAIIAIDGRCGSGKSTMAALIAKKYDCNIFRMDDFFLPFEMKTKERLAQPGGNVHYERFQEEVLGPLQNGKAVIHRPYNCTVGALDEPLYTATKKLNIVEGVYCMHPKLKGTYDFKLFLTVDSPVQQDRIHKRSGEAKLELFINKWIPMEEYYFSMLNVEAQCDIVVNTTSLQNT